LKTKHVINGLLRKKAEKFSKELLSGGAADNTPKRKLLKGTIVLLTISSKSQFIRISASAGARGEPIANLIANFTNKLMA